MEIELKQFLDNKIFASLRKKIRLASQKKQMKLGCHSYSILGMPAEITKILKSETFRSLLKQFNIRAKKPLLIAFDHGDFTLMNDKSLQSYRCLIDFSEKGKECGGYLSFVADGKESIRRNPSPNSFFVFPKQKFFVKYINSNAKKPIVYLFC